MAQDIMLSTACRCCLMEDNDMVYVFDILDEFNMKINELIVRNGAITILEDDAFSKHICGNCLNDLAIAERFVLRCRKTNDLLMNLIVDNPQESNASMIEDNEHVADPSEEDVSYVLVSTGSDCGMLVEHSMVEDQSIGEIRHFAEDVHTTSFMAADPTSIDNDVLLLNRKNKLLTAKHVCFDVAQEDTLEYESNTLDNEDASSIKEMTEISVNNELYAEIFNQNHTKAQTPTDSLGDYNNLDFLGSDDERNSKVISGKLYDFKHNCDQCGASFVKAKNYARHLQSHNILACQECLKIFNSEQILLKHQTMCQRGSEHRVVKSSFDQEPQDSNFFQRRKSFICPYCNKPFVSQSALATHERTHTGERPFACNYCAKRFKTLAGVDLHERRHSGNKPYACQICNKRFAESSNLKVHMLQHTKEKPHVCTICSRAFARVFLLQLHMRTHTGEKPYACVVCEQRFSQQGDLASHHRIHSGEKPYACDICGKKFTKSSAATQHRKSHKNQLIVENIENTTGLDIELS
ncbi:zinc finger protein 436-like [Anopheles nili]|uniref:zinc finger protein 436-like n=1 Tax=Anopheles nili TaxID=185578 RepID=UPI00237A519D|nr:zinc finger protein 436-like [Anopheles nili]